MTLGARGPLCSLTSSSEVLQKSLARNVFSRLLHMSTSAFASPWLTSANKAGRSTPFGRAGRLPLQPRRVEHANAGLRAQCAHRTYVLGGACAVRASQPPLCSTQHATWDTASVPALASARV
jgi:hypothetical protein